VRIASGRGGGTVLAEEVEAAAPGHHLAELIRIRGSDLEAADAAELRVALRRAEAAGMSREDLSDLHLTILRREERWDEFSTEMRRLALGPHRSLVDKPLNWRFLAKACEVRGRPGEFRETALAAAGGPLSSESRGTICDLLIDSGDIDAAVSMLERWMRPGQPPDPGLAQRVERLKTLRPGRR
jgi:hypothetical protein